MTARLGSGSSCPRAAGNLTHDDLCFLLSHGIAMNLDSLDQLRDVASRACGARVGLRVLIDAGNPGDGMALDKPCLQSIGVTALDYSYTTCP